MLLFRSIAPQITSTALRVLKGAVDVGRSAEGGWTSSAGVQFGNSVWNAVSRHAANQGHERPAVDFQLPVSAL